MKRILPFLLCALLVSTGAFARRGIGGVSSAAGFLAAGHWIVSPISSTIVPIAPLADNVTNATARIHQAYWDGTNDIPYDLVMDDEFGAYPYVCTLIQGPPGMTVQQSTYTTSKNPNYCRVIWHPQGNISSAWNGEAEVAITDQQHNTIDMSWALWTVGPYSTGSFSASYSVNGSSTLTISGTCTGTLTPGTVLTGTDIAAGTYIAFDLTGTGCDGTYAMSTASTGTASGTVTGSYGQGGLFVSTTGSGSTCSYSAPCTLTTAFGSTYSGTSYPGGIVYAFGGSYTGATDLPVYADATLSNVFQPNGARKPNALIGIPGQTVTLDASANQYFIYTGDSASDWFMENITANGFLNNTADCDRLIQFGNSGRLIFDQVNWTNSGYGCPSSGNMSMFYSGGIQTPRNYLAITYSAESNRQTGAVGNNYAFADIYSFSHVLIQGNEENSPSANFDGCFYFKSDVTYSEMRENYANVGGSNHCFDYGQSQDSGIGNDETDYNLGLNIGSLWGGGGNFTWQSIAFYRNTILAGSGVGVNIGGGNTYNLEGPGSPGPLGAVSSTTAGSLIAGTSYDWKVTSLGVTGESAPIIGSNGNSATGKVAGNGNAVTLVIATGDSSATLSWLAEPGAVGYMGYRELTSCGGGPGCWTQYSLGNVTSWTDTGAAGTAANPPAAPGNAVSTARFSYYANIWATTNATKPPPSGATVCTAIGTGCISSGVPTNVVDSSASAALPNTTNIVCFATGTGCMAIGDLNTNYSGYGTTVIQGEEGYQIQ